MNYIDLILLLLLAGSVFGGLKNGFIAELASLLALILGVWGAIKFAGFSHRVLVEQWNLDLPYAGIVSFVITLLIIAAAVHLLARIIQKMAEAANLSIANRVLGAFLSLFKSLFFLGVLLLVIDQYAEKISFLPVDKIESSKLSKPMRNLALSSFPFLQGVYDGIKGSEKNEKDEENES
jgi:membrane protein required for colicin V production